MPKTPKERLTNLKVREVSLVDSGDNPPARAVMWKRRTDAPDVAKMAREHFGRVRACANEAFTKATFDEVFAEEMLGDAFGVLMGRLDMLHEAIWDAVFGFDGSDNPERDIRTSVEQFAESVDDDLTGILAGSIVKRFGGDDGATCDAEATEAIGEVLAKFAATEPKESAADEHADHEQGEPMAKKPDVLDMSKLDDDTRKLVEAEIAKANDAKTAAEAERDTLQKAADDAASAAADDPKDDDTAPDPLAKAGPEVAAIVKGLQTDNETLRKTVDAMAKREDARDVEAMVDGIDNLPGDRDETVEMLKSLPSAARATVIDGLRKAAAVVTKTLADGASPFDDIGSGHGNPEPTPGGATVLAKVETMAKDIRKADPSVTIEQARAQVWTENPGLYDEHEAETRGRPN